MTFQSKIASKVLPHIIRLLNGLTLLMTKLPDIAKSESEFISGNYERIVVERREDCESIHPVPRGTTEKFVSIPGAKSLKFTIDRQTFNVSINTSAAGGCPLGVNCPFGANCPSNRNVNTNVCVCYC